VLGGYAVYYPGLVSLLVGGISEGCLVFRQSVCPQVNGYGSSTCSVVGPGVCFATDVTVFGKRGFCGTSLWIEFE